MPKVIGLTIGEARAAWTAAGFIGAFSPRFGLNNKVVETQDPTPGSCLSASTTIAVTYS